MKIFAQITKVDVAKREVWGRATQEVVDKAGEVFDYESSVPFFKTWSEGFAKDTDGKSLGNIRSMHGKVAAGKVIAIDFNDAEKAIDIGTKIVDNNEWEKVLEGVHTGFSIGGSYVKKWSDPVNKDAIRFTADPAEISIVDSPCVPTAKFFDVVKADGSMEKMAFREAPIPSEPLFKSAQTLGELRKGLWTVADLAGLLQSLGWMVMDTASEAEWEGDASPVPAKLRTCLEGLVEAFLSMTQEETSELLASLPKTPTEPQVMQLAAGLGLELAKKGAKFSTATLEKLNSMHKAAMDAVGALADCWKDDGGSVEASHQAEMTKATADRDEALTKVATLEADLAKANTVVAELTTKVQQLENLPEPAKGLLKVLVEKADELTLNSMTGGADRSADELKKIEQMPEGEEKVLALIKFNHRTGAR